MPPRAGPSAPPATGPSGRLHLQVVPASAAFDISAVVAAAEPYSFDAGAFLSPVDLVMTWGRLPEEPYHGRVSYYQITRYYFWRTRDAGLDLLTGVPGGSDQMSILAISRLIAAALCMT